MIRLVIVVLFIVVLCAEGLAALAHTPEEMTEWDTDWQQRVTDRGVLSMRLIDERLDMLERHPWWYPGWSPPTPDPIRTVPVAAASHGAGMGSGNVEQWRHLVADHFPAEAVNRMLRIMACESGGNPAARNPSGASGLLQVMPFWADHFGIPSGDLFDPATNVRIARKVWDEQGYGAWVCKG